MQTFHGSLFAASMLMAALAGAGCGRMAMDYEIRVDRPGGEVRHVPETATFASGEKFRLRITTHNDGYLYVLNKGTSGNSRMLLPDPRINNGDAFVRGWTDIVIPREGHGAYQFDARPGVETVFMCFSRRAVPALDTVAHGQETDPARVESLIQRLEAEATRHGQVWKTQHSNHAQIVLDSPDPDAVMVNTIRLAHRRLGQ